MPVSIQIERAAPTERLYAVAEIAASWNLSTDKVRELFEAEPGVLVIADRNPRRKRRYRTLRIPQTVVDRVYTRLSIYRRHLKRCKQRHDGRSYRRCPCPVWVDGLLNGVEIRRSLKTRDWQSAHELVRQWEADGKREERPAPIAVKDACDKFISDAEARGLREPTVYKYRLLFRQLQEFAGVYGLPLMVNFDVDWVRRFRASWPNKNIAARKKLEALRAFFRFVHESGWISTNPASRLKPPKITGTSHCASY